VSRLSRELVSTLGTPELRERLTALGVDPWPGTSAELGELLRVDIERYGKIARSAGLRKQ
jgi:tripartite-type tricarboxylate transporter receptor subunit TctC